MGCPETWQWMMQALDGILPEDRERKMLIHLGGCRQCADLWMHLQETALLLPETAEEPGEELVSGIMLNLPEISRKKVECAFGGFAMAAALLMAIGGAGVYFSRVQAESSGLVQFAAGLANAAFSAIDGLYRLSVILLGERWQEVTGTAALISAIVVMCVGAVIASLRMARREFVSEPGRNDGFKIQERGMGL
jgi:hypothetical protein